MCTQDKAKEWLDSGSDNAYEAEDIIKGLLADIEDAEPLLIKARTTLTAFSNNDLMGMGADEAIADINSYFKQDKKS